MKILYIVNVLPDSENPSAQVFVKAQIDSIRKVGIDVTVYNIRGNVSRWNYLKAIIVVRKIMRKENFDIVHGHYVYSGWIAALQRRCPVVVSFMGSDLNGSPKTDGTFQLQGHFDVWISRLLQYFVDGIIVKSKRMQERLIKKKHSIVLPNGVDFSVFKEIPRDEARRKLGLDSEKKYVLFAGNYRMPTKAFSVVRKAVEMIKAEDQSVELLLAHGIAHEFIPYYMNAANVLALASLKEGSPNVIKEAMACNLPIVATDVGDVKEITQATKGCKIVNRDSKEFAKAIREILLTFERTKGREAIEDLRIEKVAARLINFYENILTSREKAAKP